LIAPYGRRVLIVGPSASGKSTVATGLLSGLIGEKYQVCVIDPEGDYESFEGAFVLGNAKRAPTVEESIRLLDNPGQSAVLSLTGMPLTDRPPFFLELLPRLLQMRTTTGRPHWIMLDEAHHLMPPAWQLPQGLLPEEMVSLLLITVHPDLLSKSILERIDTVVLVGQEAREALEKFTSATGHKLPALPDTSLDPGEVLLWSPGQKQVQRVVALPSRWEHRRSGAGREQKGATGTPVAE
jgi:energy-coupling factor transporter ATP-binding protein EcfA2